MAAASLQENGQLFRKNANLVLIALSDSQDENFNFDSFKSSIEKLVNNKRWTIFVIGNPSNEPCVNAEMAQSGIESLVGWAGGKMFPICSPDYGELLKKAVSEIMVLFTDFSIASAIPDGTIVDPQSLSVTIDGKSVPNSLHSGFLYQEDTKSISFSGAYVPGNHQKVEVRFEYWNP